MKEQEDLHFKTNVQLKSIIGKDLINDDNIAVLELVKNSFDADAKRVDIIFNNLKKNDDKNLSNLTPFTKDTTRIIIKDNGVGMSFTDIRDKWLNIAFSEKKTNTRQYNRMMAGAKGVGRFSCDRLGEYLFLYAKKESSNEYIKLFVDWKAFEIENDKNKEIQSIPIKHEVINKNDIAKLGIEPFEKGIALEIIKLRSQWVYPIKNDKGVVIDWNTDKLVNLKKYLEKLINPNQAFENNDFGIYLNADEFVAENETNDESKKFIGKVENTIFEKLDFKATSIESKILENGKVIFSELKDKGQTIFWIKERNEFYPEIKNVKIFLYYLNPYAKAFFTKQTGTRAVEYGSIYVFLNGFRIPPYGEFGDDWLNLEQRKGQGYARFLSQRELVGRIEILDFDNDFQVISSREGIVKNESYKKLTDQKNSYFFKIFKRLEKYVVDGLDWDSIPENDRDRISEIEKKIISGETKDEDLIFREDDITKRRRIYNAIHSIIQAKAENVIELYINESLILDKINEERENSEREFEQLINDFENKKIDAEILNRILQKKAEQNKELEKQLSEFAKYSTNEATTKALLELQNYKKTIEEQSELIKELKNQLEKTNYEKIATLLELENAKIEKEIALRKATEEESKRVIAEQEKEKAEQLANTAIEDKEKKEKVILFQQKLLTQDLEQLLEFHHNIGISANTIEGHLINIKDDLKKGRMPNKEELFELIENVSYETNKITSITNLATAANFNADTDDIDTDLGEFVKQYVNRVKLGKLKSSSGDNMQINIVDNSKGQFLYHFKPLEIAIVIDNLLSNSRKANATEVTVHIENSKENSLNICFKDNGNGIKPTIIDKIFDFGFTTTSGSGLGLYHLKKIINERYKGEIKVNKSLSNGAEFTLIFEK